MNKKIDTDLLSGMSLIRSFTSIALTIRAKKNIRVRQPLQSFSIAHDGPEPKYWNELKEILKEEINVKEIIFKKGKGPDGHSFELSITPELKEEGILRDLIREIQAARKKEGLKPKDKAAAALDLPKEIFEVAEKNEESLMKETNLKSVKISEAVAIKISLK